MELNKSIEIYIAIIDFQSTNLKDNSTIHDKRKLFIRINNGKNICNITAN